MLIKGITQIPNIISESERHELINLIRATSLNDESGMFHYGNSSGNQISPQIYDRLTEVIKSITGLSIEKENAFARIYKSGSKLKSHIDREGLDITLSIQLKNDFVSTPIYAKGYDGTIYRSDLNDCDGVLLKGRELEHWRNDIFGQPSDELICIFFHWRITSLEYIEIENFLTDDECDEVINSNVQLSESMVLSEGKAVVMSDIRDAKVGFYQSEKIDLKLKELMGNLKLEGLQLLKYDKSNKFTPHFDERYSGYERLFTTIVYLNDNYKDGNTNFTNLGLKIIPKKGKLIIWKNIKKDAQGNWITNPLTMHESLPVKKGTKYSLVNWGLL
jgi:2OG-Fe(II) oxygenase superfamily